MKTFLEKYIYPLMIATSLGIFGYVVRFELLASEVKTVKQEQKSMKTKQTLITWLLCEDAIEKGKEEAKKRCKEVLKDEKKI